MQLDSTGRHRSQLVVTALIHRPISPPQCHRKMYYPSSTSQPSYRQPTVCDSVVRHAPEHQPGLVASLNKIAADKRIQPAACRSARQPRNIRCTSILSLCYGRTTTISKAVVLLLCTMPRGTLMAHQHMLYCYGTQACRLLKVAALLRVGKRTTLPGATLRQVCSVEAIKHASMIAIHKATSRGLRHTANTRAKRQRNNHQQQPVTEAVKRTCHQTSSSHQWTMVLIDSK
jgi:hypothetical protein